MPKIIQNFLSILLVISIVFLQSGCSMLAPSRQSFSVIASEPDAQIYINGEFIGTGNITTRVPRDKGVSVMAKKEGYYPATRDIGTKMSFIGILDIIGGCIFLLPFIGLGFPGAHTLDMNNVSIVLQKASNN